MNDYSQAEKRLKILLQFWVVCFLGSTIVFLFFGNDLIYTINSIGLKYFPSLPTLELPQEKFWLTLTLSLMVTLIFLCYWAQKDIQKNTSFVLPILVSKFMSTFFFFCFFFFEKKSLAYLVGGFTDGSVFLITYYFFKPTITKIRKL